MKKAEDIIKELAEIRSKRDTITEVNKKLDEIIKILKQLIDEKI